MKRFFLGLTLAAALLGGCSKEAVENGGAGDETRIPITFTLSTPGSEGVIYPKSRAIQDAPEYAIKNMSLLVYDATDASTPKFLRKHDLKNDIVLYDNGNGTYTFSLEAPISDMNAKRKFVFVINDDASVAATETGTSEADLHTKTASIEMANNDKADKLADPDQGIVMSGTATTSDGTASEVITITPDVKCQVKLTRIVARIDLKNNTPNMKIESAELVSAATKGYLFAQNTVQAPTADRVKIASNSTVDITTAHPTQNAGNTFTPLEFKKVFYTYERPNTTADYAAVRITYTVNESKGTIEVPFIRTADGLQTPVDIERNHLYTIVLGNGKPVITNPVEVTIQDEDWNLVEMPEEIGPGDVLDPASQKQLNEGLMVYKLFTDYNVKSLTKEGGDPATWKVTFETALNNTPENTSYFSYTWLSGQDVDGTTSSNGINTEDLRNMKFSCDDGKTYRIPTAGELALLVPMFTEEEDRPSLNNGANIGVYHLWWNDNPATSQNFVTIETPFIETIYLQNGENFAFNTSGTIVSGITQLKVGEKFEEITNNDSKKYNVHPVYGLRFKGSDQYAAYRWESCPIDSDPLQRYLSIKIKALHPEDNKTTIDDVANDEKFWTENSYIEYKIPACGGFYNQEGNQTLGVNEYIWSSTARLDDDFAYRIGSDLNVAHTNYGPKNINYQLRLVHAEE